MAVTPTPIYAQAPMIGSIDLTAKTACTTRAPTVTANLAAANIFQFLNTSTNGQRVDYIIVNAASSVITSATAANLVQIWIWDGTTAWINNEIIITAVTPSATVPGFTTTYLYVPPLILPSTYKLYASVTVTTVANTTALIANAYGGLY